MDDRYTKLYWVGAGAVLLLLLLSSFALILPRVVNSAKLKSIIKAQVAKRINAEFDFQKADLIIVPYPAVSLKQVSLSIPAIAQIHLETLKVYPQILPLLIGRTELAKIVIDSPDFSLALRPKAREKPEVGILSNLAAFLETVSAQIPPVLEAVSGLDVGIKQGTLRLFSGDSQGVLVKKINGEFNIENQNLTGAVSSFTVSDKNEKTIAKLEKLKGKIHYSDQVTEMTVEDFSLSYPQVQLSGTYIFDQKIPHASLDISSQKVNIAEIHEILPDVIKLFNGDLPAVREISDLISGGIIPQASLHVEGKSAADLTVFESMHIQAHVVDGTFLLSDYGLDLQDVAAEVAIDRGILKGRGLQGRMGKSSGSGGSFRLDLLKKDTSPFHLDINLNADLSDLFKVLKQPPFREQVGDDLSVFKSIEGTSRGRLILEGSLESPSLLAEIENISARIESDQLSYPVRLNSSGARISLDEITFDKLKVDLLDGTFTCAGSLENFISLPAKADIKLEKAEIGQNFITWFAEQAKVPNEYLPRTPLIISQANINWTQTEILKLQGDFSVKNGPNFAIDITHNAEGVVLRNLTVNYGNDQAALMLDLRKRRISAEFHGGLSKKTIDAALLHNENFPDAWVKGDIRFLFDLDTFANSSGAGSLEGGSFIIPWNRENRFLLNEFSLTALDRTVKLNSSQVRFEEEDYTINGVISLMQKGLLLNLNVLADTIELDKILAASKKENELEISATEAVDSNAIAVNGTINVQANSLQYNGYTWEPFKSVITLENSLLTTKVLEAELCGISTPGVLTLQNGEITLDFTLEAVSRELKKVLICFEGGTKQMTGTLNLGATIKGKGNKDTIRNSLEGNLQFISADGYIYQDAKMAKLLSYLNVSNLFRGKVPDLTSTGFHYDSLFVKGTMEKGIITVTPAKLDAPIMEISAYGTVDIPNKSVDFQLLVAPLQTINKIQKLLPIINMILPESLVAVPVQVKGDFADIEVNTMSMSAISKNIFGIMFDALSTPVRVLTETSEEEK